MTPRNDGSHFRPISGVERLESSRATFLHRQGSNARLDRRDERHISTQLVHAESEEDRDGLGVAGERAADTHPPPVLAPLI